jgi:hypothetical protein
MKNVLLFLLMLAILASCNKQASYDGQSDDWNGYDKFLKEGEKSQRLMAGKTIHIGWVTYSLTVHEGVNCFMVRYNTVDPLNSGWTISETHMYAGSRDTIPLNKPGNPKVGNFPFASYHNPRVSEVIHYVPVNSQPPYTGIGFIVSAHCVAYSASNQQETAWAEGVAFTDKGWGFFDNYTYTPDNTAHTILYGISYSNTNLILYHIDATNGSVEQILNENVGQSNGSYDAAAYDAESGAFIFVKSNNNEPDQLWVNNMHDDDASFYAGILEHEATNATYHDGVYYYIYFDATTNTNKLQSVTFNSDMTIDDEIYLSTIPSSVSVSDIAMRPGGAYLDIAGSYNGNDAFLVSYIMATGEYYALTLTQQIGGYQIAYGDNGLLYGIYTVTSGNGTEISTFNIDTSTGSSTLIDDDIIIVDPFFTDVSSGPAL